MKPELSLPKLKSSVYLKTISEDMCYATDVSDDGDKIYKFEGPSKIFIQHLQAKSTYEKLLIELKQNYENLDENNIKKDLASFFKKLQEFQFIE